MPKKLKLSITIVIPVYDDENHLKACLDSVARQTVKPDAVILVDNNCTDNSMKIAARYSFVKIMKEPRQGVIFARNRGFDAAKTDLIGRIDSDTILPDDWVSRVLNFYQNANNDNIALTGGGYFYNIRFKRFAGWLQGQVAFRFNRLLLGHYILFGSNMVITNAQWKAVRGQTCDNIDIHEDLDLAIHLRKLNYDIAYDESLRVGVAMKRVRSKRSELWKNMLWWPNTLRIHNKKTWILGYFGAGVLYMLSPVLPILERVSKLFGKEELPD